MQLWIHLTNLRYWPQRERNLKKELGLNNLILKRKKIKQPKCIETIWGEGKKKELTGHNFHPHFSRMEIFFTPILFLKASLLVVFNI